MAVEIRVRTRRAGFEIGLRRAGATYEVVADWWGIAEIGEEKFIRDLAQRYAYRAVRSTIEAQQGFSIVNEERDAEGRIHVVLRRMA